MGMGQGWNRMGQGGMGLGQICDRTRTDLGQDLNRPGTGKDMGQIWDRMGLAQIRDRTRTDLRWDGMALGQDGMGGCVR